MKFLYASTTAVVIGLCCIGCWRSVEKYGDVPDEKAPRTKITDILFSPQHYLNKEVVIDGTIASECPTGGWINVEDTAGHTMYVEFHGADFAPIPQRQGRKVIVNGIVFQSESASKEIQLLGKGVEIR